MPSQRGRGNPSAAPGFASTQRVDPSSLSRPVRPLLSVASATASSTASSSAASWSSSSSSMAASAPPSQPPPLTFPAFTPAAAVDLKAAAADAQPIESTDGTSSAAVGASVDSGGDVQRCIVSQLAALLSLASDDFVSHCLHNSSLHVLLSSYLHHASQLSAAPPSESATIAEAVYLVLHRFTAAAPPATLSAAHFVSLPLLLHFASLYYPSMPDSTAAIVDRLMAALPPLSAQLTAFCAALSASLESVQAGLSLPAPLSFVTSSIDFLSSSYGSLHALFACTPSCPSTAPFVAHSSFLSTSVRLYERMCELGRDKRGGLFPSISACRRVLLSAVHAIIDKALIQCLQRESGDVKRLSDTLYQLVADCQQHTPLFLAHYAHLYRLSADIKKIATLPTVVAALGAPRVSQLLSSLPPPQSAVPLPTASLFRSHSSESKEEQSIAELRAMFDNAISNDFARACLREFNGELDVTLQHIFDNALPARLQRVSEHDRRQWTEEGDSKESDEKDWQGDMLADGDEGNSSFQAYLLRTGRVLKTDSDKSAAALSRSSLSLFEAEPSVREMLKERIIASQALDAMYDDEYDDSYASFLSFTVDETAVDVNDRSDNRRGHRHDRASSATAEAGKDSGGGGEDVRARWRRETAEREGRMDDEKMQRIELIPPSRRTAEERREWDRLTQQQQQGQPQQPTSQTSAGAARGMRGMRARGGQPRDGGGRAVSDAVIAPGYGGGSGPNNHFGIRNGGAAVVDGTLGPAHAPRGRGGRGRDSRMLPAMSADEKEADRSRRVLQAAKDREDRRRRLNSDEDDDDAAVEIDQDEMELTTQSVLSRGAEDAGVGGQHGDAGTEGDSGGRGRGNSTRHTLGSGPRNFAGGAGRGGRGRGHNARGAHKAMAMRKMNSGMAR